MRKIQFVNNEYYHIFNRGVDKRSIFSRQKDIERFFQSMQEFNTLDPIGSIYENSFRKDKLGNLVSKQKKIVDFVCYCLNPNHFHFILKQLTENGIEKFMHRIGVGYTKYFNKKYKREGALFQGTFKAIHINSNTYLLHLTAYINLNDRVHQTKQLGNLVSKSSWKEYITNNKNGVCTRNIVLNQFKNVFDFKKFAEDSLKNIHERKDIEELLLE